MDSVHAFEFQLRMEKLVAGQTYFIVVFNDEDLKVSVVQTLVYVEDRSSSSIKKTPSACCWMARR